MMDGSKYDGEWQHNLRHGMGTHWLMNGDVYKGEWSQGMKHGRGQLRRKKEGIIITGTFEYGKASGLCVVSKTVDGKQHQELIVYKKGIQVAKNKKGVECGDYVLAFFSIIFWLVYFIGFPVYLSMFDLVQYFATGDFPPAISAVVVVVWIIWMCAVSFGSESARYIHNMQDFVECLQNIDKAIKSPPEIYWHMESYHYETRTREVRDQNGNVRVEQYQEKVVTHVANSKFRLIEWQDESAPIASLFYLQAMMLTRLHTNKDIEFSDVAYTRYNEEK